MRKTSLWVIAVALVAAVAIACTGSTTTPTAPTESAVLATTSATSSGSSALAAAVAKTPISGTLVGVGEDAPGRIVMTPSGMCHSWEYPVYTELHGDVEGPVTFYEQGHGPCDFSHLAGSGPFEGEVVWQGREGIISGQWTTNCKPDPTSAVGLSCDGTMNARGSRGLEGVQFHFKWGPGWYPFPVTGTAFAK